ncbi:MAG: hypothetical protein R3C01_05680 [Planctomycetaceae bacterium]
MNSSTLLDDEHRNRLERELSELFRQSVSIDPSLHKSLGDASVTVCKMDYRRSSDNGRQWVQQTAIVFEAADLELPLFAMWPRPTGVLGSIASTLLTMENLDFADTPEFQERYCVFGWAKEATEILFSPELRAALSEREGLSIRGHRRLLVISRDQQVLAVENEIDDFVHEAIPLLSLFRQGEAALDALPDVSRKATAQEMLRTTASMGGLAGNLLHNSLQRQLAKTQLSPDELEQFVRSPVPRDIPRGLARQVVGENGMLIVVGILFLIVGLVVGGGTVLLTKGNERWIGMLFLVLFPLIGGSMAGFTFRYRRRKQRLLREGLLAEGTVKSVMYTGMQVNNDLAHCAVIEYLADGTPHSTTSYLYRESAEKARQFAESSTPVRILIDPADSTHILLLDTLTTIVPD